MVEEHQHIAWILALHRVAGVNVTTIKLLVDNFAGVLLGLLWSVWEILIKRHTKEIAASILRLLRLALWPPKMLPGLDILDGGLEFKSFGIEWNGGSLWMSRDKKIVWNFIEVVYIRSRCQEVNMVTKQCSPRQSIADASSSEWEKTKESNIHKRS